MWVEEKGYKRRGLGEEKGTRRGKWRGRGRGKGRGGGSGGGVGSREVEREGWDILLGTFAPECINGNHKRSK